MNAASIFLSCNIDSLPFKFLGVKVGDSPRKLSIWRDLINHFKNRLVGWKGKHLTIAVRVMLINSVLNVIPIYTLSFYKAPSKVVRYIRRIQSISCGMVVRVREQFIGWSGVLFDEWGLCVKDVDVMNMALLNKWKWGILKDQNATWKKILSSRYENIENKVSVGRSSVLNSSDSIWWRDLVLVDSSIIPVENRFISAVRCTMGYGNDTTFWYSKWICSQPLWEAYP